MYILFDIGGTKMRLASSHDGENIDEMRIERTPTDNFDQGMEIFARVSRELAGGKKIKKIAGGIAGVLDKRKTNLINSTHIFKWVGKPLKGRLETLCRAPVHIENDGNVVGLGETHYGAGRGYGIVAYITVSTGVGGGRIVNGKIDISAYGFEPGHQIINIGGEECSGCGGYGDLEALVSGTALEKRIGKPPKEISQDDPIWDELARTLAVGLNNVVVTWSPDVIVLGGSMMVRTPGIRPEVVQKYLKETVKIFPTIPDVKRAELEDEGGLYGALALVKMNQES